MSSSSSGTVKGVGELLRRYHYSLLFHGAVQGNVRGRPISALLVGCTGPHWGKGERDVVIVEDKGGGCSS